MNLRRLVRQALAEAREEIAPIIQRKLDALMGETDEPAVATSRPRRGRPPKVAPVAMGAHRPGPGRPAGAGTRATRSAADPAALRQMILGAFQPGESLSRAELMKAAGLPESDSVRVTNVLSKLKADGLVAMTGANRGARYRMKGRTDRNASD